MGGGGGGSKGVALRCASFSPPRPPEGAPHFLVWFFFSFGFSFLLVFRFFCSRFFSFEGGGGGGGEDDFTKVG